MTTQDIARMSTTPDFHAQLSEIYLGTEILWDRLIAQYGCQGLTDKQDLSPLEKSLREDGIKFFRDNGSILVTHNVREFGRVTGLQIEDWYN